MLGLRVVRGPDWKWDNQDGGEGGLGTVVEVRNREVMVQWHTGSRANYRCGHDGKHDLLAYDSAPTGVTHMGVKCDHCCEHPVMGIRWKCATCGNFDLCNSCYNEGKHNNSHPFLRFDESGGTPTNIGKRTGSIRKEVRGLCPGAIVKRGKDWEWGPQDGGSANTGTITAYYHWKGSFARPHPRTGAAVSWNGTGFSNNYRIGFEGKVDLLCITPAAGGNYYKNHLVKLDVPAKTSPSNNSSSNNSSSNNNSSTTFSPGDKVVIALDADTVKTMQEGHGGWNVQMQDAIGKVGKVVNVNVKGDVCVKYDMPNPVIAGNPVLQILAQLVNQDWVFNPTCLKKVETFSVGDKVKVLHNKGLVEKMQHGHGGWVNSMASSLGEVGVVNKVDDDGDIRIRVVGTLWTFSPAALTKDLEGNDGEAVDIDLKALLTNMLLSDFLESLDVQSESDADIVSAAAQGHKDKVEKIIKRNSGAVNQLQSGKSALHLSCHQGHQDITELLISHGANVNLEDDEGDTPLHFAAHGSKYPVTRYLIRFGAEMNTKNKKGLTALHISAFKGNEDMIRLLINSGCEVNTQDEHGDTPLHDAISQNQIKTAEILIDSLNIDFTLTNKRGFNVLHHAVLKGKESFVQQIIDKTPEIINMRKDDGFAALHLAVVNAHQEIVRIILATPTRELELKTLKGQTALMLAAHEGYMHTMRTLLNCGADLNAEDCDGDTSVHVALQKHRMVTTLAEHLVGVETRPDLAMIKMQFEQDKASGIAIACYLGKMGADLDYCNHKGQTPLDIIDDPHLKDLLWQFSTKRQTTRDSGVPSPKPEPIVTHSPPPSLPISTAQVPVQKCKLCNDNEVDSKFIPCGHSAFCEDCAQTFRRCPSCKKEFTRIENTSLANLTPCIICVEEKANVQFQPCGHKVVCYVCSKRVKVCLTCSVTVAEKKVIGPIPVCEEPLYENERFNCNICFDRPREVTFLCGHGSCTVCSRRLVECHMCRLKIERVIPIYHN